MKWFIFALSALLLITGCQKNQEPVKTMFSGNIGPNLQVDRSIRIQPDNPMVNDVLTISKPGNINVKTVTWYINDQQSGIANSLNSGLKKGDSITAVVSYTEGKSKQEEFVTPAVGIKDSPPVITSINLEPMYPTIASTINVSVQASDTDGDPVTFDYKWYVNNNPVGDQTGDSFSCGTYKHGDIIHVVVTPSDGEQNGVNVVSSYISIQDTPPAIISNPPSYFTGGTYSYQVEAVDIDNDPLTYKLESSPQGMTISKDGLITWETGDIKSPVRVTVKVVADDGYGGKSYQTFNLNIEKRKL